VFKGSIAFPPPCLSSFRLPSLLSFFPPFPGLIPYRWWEKGGGKVGGIGNWEVLGSCKMVVVLYILYDL